MIGCVDTKAQAHDPIFPLDTLRSFVGSPSSIRVRNIPKKIGNWNITNVYVTVVYPDQSIKSVECVLTGGVYVGTIEGCNISGKCEDGFTISADGTDENGNQVSGYIIGKGDVEILEADGTITPGTTTYYVHLCDGRPSEPKEGDMYQVGTTWYIYQNGQEKSISSIPSYIVNTDTNERISANGSALHQSVSQNWTCTIDSNTYTLILAFDPSDPSEIPVWNYDDTEYITLTYQETSGEIEWLLSYYNSDTGYSFTKSQFGSTDTNTLNWTDPSIYCSRLVLTQCNVVFDLDLAPINQKIFELSETVVSNSSDIVNLQNNKQDNLTTDQLFGITGACNEYNTTFYFSGGTVESYPLTSITTQVLIDLGIKDSSGWVKHIIGLVIGKSVRSIGLSTFYNHTWLANVVFPKPNSSADLISIGQMAFYGTGVHEIRIEGSYKTSPSAFANCLGLNKVILGPNVNLGRNTFSGTDTLQYLCVLEKTNAEVRSMANYPWGISNTSLIHGAYPLPPLTYVRKVNNTAPDANGNVNVTASVGHTVTINLTVGEEYDHPNQSMISVGGYTVGSSGSDFTLFTPNGNNVTLNSASPVTFNNQNFYIRDNSIVPITQDTTLEYYVFVCLAKGTLVKLFNGDIKKIEDVTYDDLLMVWNFDEGKIDWAYPAWIKRSDITDYYWYTKLESGKTIKTCGHSGHRLFSLDENKFLYVKDLVGHNVYTSDGSDKVIDTHIVQEPVYFYNLITKDHINLFCNDILTGCSLNNGLYPVENMKFVKDFRPPRPYIEFEGKVSKNWYTDCRYTESNLDHDYLVKYYTDRSYLDINKDKNG